MEDNLEIFTVRPDSISSLKKENEDLRGLKIPNQISIIESADPKERTSFDRDHMVQASEKTPSSKLSDFINHIAPGI